MTALGLARWQFAITTVYHFFFVPLTLGLSILVAIMETMYVRTGNEEYKRMTKFWGKLFVINFAMGVVTGLVMEFQFGMNWSEYSRFVGDIFGVPLAIEALLAFFLESTFLGIWIFGWEVLPKVIHAAAIWLVAIGANISALWILIANSFMQEPVGYVLRNGRAEMTDVGALVTNPHVWVQFPHVFFAGMTTAGFFVLGISAYHLFRGSGEPEGEGGNHFRRSFHIALVWTLIGSIMVGLVGHTQGQKMFQTQPMKMAAAEALWESDDPAPFSLFTIGNEREREDVFAIHIPYLLTILAYNSLEGEVKGINDLQAEYEELYGPGDYVPPVAVSYWAFRFMFIPGVIMPLVALLGLYLVLRNRLHRAPWYLRYLPLAIPLPYLANTGGWLLTEVGRQPWIVFGLMRTEEGVSTAAPVGAIFASLVVLALVYTGLIVADVYLLSKFARRGMQAEEEETRELAVA
ncbi:MAG: cytochrome ubiquinol oxidase subunit I [Anaerolineae bacterium]|jgi:cytochrome d ubiquinol oxidase subunit I|nr:cytochrome ubiquinol oxidase subunit I [Anaerolineae bacterium]MDX9829079.1 cytochrome ubiquinol oxidase subunit I [Anaerolineae bacterium]